MLKYQRLWHMQPYLCKGMFEKYSCTHVSHVIGGTLLQIRTEWELLICTFQHNESYFHWRTLFSHIDIFCIHISSAIFVYICKISSSHIINLSIIHIQQISIRCIKFSPQLYIQYFWVSRSLGFPQKKCLIRLVLRHINFDCIWKKSFKIILILIISNLSKSLYALSNKRSNIFYGLILDFIINIKYGYFFPLDILLEYASRR